MEGYRLLPMPDSRDYANEEQYYAALLNYFTSTLEDIKLFRQLFLADNK